MIGRSPTRVAAIAAAATVLASGCATFDNTDTVAEVEGTTIDNDQLQPLLAEFTERSGLFDTSPIINGRATGDDTRIMVGALVQQELFRSFADDNGLELDELRQSFIDESLAGSEISDTSDELQVLVSDINAQVQARAVADVSVPDIDELRELYADHPARTGLICVRHILVETEAEANDVVVELDDGADFAELAAERSIDPSAAELGGAINDGSSECVTLQAMVQGFDPGFTAGALTGREGVVSGPVESSFGWHVILHRPWEEVGSAVGVQHQPETSGALLYDGHRALAQVAVDPRFGTWDPIAGGVLPAG